MSEIVAQPVHAPAGPRILRRLRAALPWVLVLAIGAGGYFGYRRYAATRSPIEPEYKVATASKRRIVGRVTASGTLQAVVTVQIGSQVSGRIQHLYADFNSPVKKGELIAKIDPQLFAASVAQASANYSAARANVAQAQAKLSDAQLTRARVQGLAAQQLATGVDVQAAETALAVSTAALDVSKASLLQAQAQLELARVNLSYTSIVSPIDGVVISRSVDVGQTVAASLQAPVLFTIAEDLRKMQVNTNVSEGDVGRIKAEMRASFVVDAFPGMRFAGKVSQIRNAAQAVQNVVTYDAVIDVDNNELKLRPGMTANVTINFDTREDALAVPNAALRFRPPPGVAGSAPPAASGSAGRRGKPAPDEADSRTLWVQRAGVVTPVSVKVGLSDGTVTEITGGALAEGDSVVSDATLPAGSTPAASPAGATTGGARRLF